jgi:hypothetical protein
MLINRIGTFCALVGSVMIGLFVLSDMAKTPTCSFLFAGGILLVLGIFLWLKNPAPPPQQTGRFRILRSGGKKQGKK